MPKNREKTLFERFGCKISRMTQHSTGLARAFLLTHEIQDFKGTIAGCSTGFCINVKQAV
jgi:hypothetical protein